MTREEFRASCGTANTVLDKADRKLAAWLSGISLAYSGAWQQHKSKTEEFEESLNQNFALDAALLFLGGVGGKLAEGAMKKAMKALSKPDSPVLAGLKKLSDKGIGSALDKTRRGPILPKFPVSPFDWNQSVNERVKKELVILTDLLLSWQEAVDKDPNFKTDFNPADTIKEALKLPVEPSALGSAISAILRGPAAMLGVLSKTELLRRPSEGLLKELSRKFKIDVAKSQSGGTDAISVLDLGDVTKPELQKEFEKGFLAFWLLEVAPFGRSMGMPTTLITGPGVAQRAALYESGPLWFDTDFDDVVHYGQSLGMSKDAVRTLIFAGMDKWPPR